MARFTHPRPSEVSINLHSMPVSRDLFVRNVCDLISMLAIRDQRTWKMIQCDVIALPAP